LERTFPGTLSAAGVRFAERSVEYGTWHAHSADFLQTGLMDTLRWVRVIGDTIFAIGAFVLGYFVLGLVTGHSYDRRGFVRQGESEIHVTDRAHAATGD
jgi:nitric oxide reductase subunit B